MATPMTIHEMVLGSCALPSLSSKTALCMAAAGVEGEGLTYGELGTAIGTIAAGLRGMGLQAGERVVLCCENRPLWCAAYVGVLAARCVCVPVEQGSGEQALREMISHCGSGVVIHSDKTFSTCVAAAEDLDRKVSVVRIDDLASPPGMGPDGVGFEVSATGGEEEGDPDHSASEAVIIYTSGTTGRPKGVVLSHRNILSNVESMKKAVRVKRDDVFLSVLPLNHTFECTAGLLVPLSEGATVAYAASLKPRELGEAMRAVRPTVVLGVPLLFEKVLGGIQRGISRSPAPQRLAARGLMGSSRLLTPVLGNWLGRALARGIRVKAGLDRVRYTICGAAPMPVQLFGGFRSLGLTITQGYGLTEASPVVAVNRRGEAKAETVGPPLPGVEVAVDSPNAEGIGELLVRGENVMLGYYRDPEGTSDALREGWLRTGDLGWVGKDGQVRISGRIKNVIVSSAGKNIYPEEIESVLLASTLIEEALVVGRVAAKGGGEHPQALIYPDRDAVAELAGCPVGDLKKEVVVDIIRREVRRLCSPLADYKRIRGFSIRDEEFPKTSTRKIKRYLFQESQTQV